jgi:hypothetical protein
LLKKSVRITPMMKHLGWLLLGGLLVFGYGYFRENPKQKLEALLKRVPQADPAKPEATQPVPAASESGPNGTVVAPWIALMRGGEQSGPERAPVKAHPLDHIAASPVGGSNSILHKTFAVATMAKFLFEIPSHAATPHLHGTFRSFLQQAAPSSDDSGNVDFLVLNQQQYGELASGRRSEALFSAEATHDQEVNLGLPVSQDQPQKYYLVFRNSSNEEGRKLVEANFTVDF